MDLSKIYYTSVGLAVAEELTDEIDMSLSNTDNSVEKVKLKKLRLNY